MKLYNKMMAVAMGCALLSLAGCGGSSDSSGGSVSLPTIDEQAISVSVVESAGSTSMSTAGGGVGGLSYDGGGAVKEGIANYIARRVIESLGGADEAALGKNVSVSIQGDTYTVTFTNESVSNPDGGSATLNGTMTLTISQSGNSVTLTASGEVENVIDSWVSAVTVDGTAYDEVVDGTWTFTYSGDITATSSQGNLTSFDLNLVSSVGSSDITITGDVTGSATITDFSVTVSGSGTDETSYTTSCSGSVTVSSGGGANATCNVKSDCSGCE